MFLGTFTPKLLTKGQLALPSKLRSGLEGNRAILAIGFDKCIYGFSLPAWDKLVEQEMLKPILTEEGRRIRQQFFSQAEEVDLDGQGRFVIPEYLRAYAGINEDLTIIGAGDHFEIWDSGEWSKLKSTFLPLGRNSDG